jgi:hypothetical protein
MSLDQTKKIQTMPTNKSREATSPLMKQSNSVPELSSNHVEV